MFSPSVKTCSDARLWREAASLRTGPHVTCVIAAHEAALAARDPEGAWLPLISVATDSPVLDSWVRLNAVFDRLGISGGLLQTSVVHNVFQSAADLLIRLKPSS